VLANTDISSVVGQLLFGYLADRYGRTRLYGIELVLVIVSTIGVATSSYGYGNMSFLALFTWVSIRTKTGLFQSADSIQWRFVMGVGECLPRSSPSQIPSR
jgi:PHS family inorganic phosphate transporter-like MFS transporter